MTLINKTSSGFTKSHIEAWNQSVTNIELYMFFMFVATILIFLTQLVIVIQLRKHDVIKIFDEKGWLT